LSNFLLWGGAELSTQVKYSGVIFDPKLGWKLLVDAKCDRALISLHQLRRSVGKTWDISPKIMQWMYTAFIRPAIAYGAVVWWTRVKVKTASQKLEHIQRLPCLYTTGAVRTTPALALELIINPI